MEEVLATKVHRLYLSISPTFSIRSANRQDITIAKAIKRVDGETQLKEPLQKVVKGAHIPNNCYVNTGFGDIYRIFRKDNLLYVQSVDTKAGICEPVVVQSSGLYIADGCSVQMMREWGSTLEESA